MGSVKLPSWNRITADEVLANLHVFQQPDHRGPNLLSILAANSRRYERGRERVSKGRRRFGGEVAREEGMEGGREREGGREGNITTRQP